LRAWQKCHTLSKNDERSHLVVDIQTKKHYIMGMTKKKREWLQAKWKEADQKARALWTTNKKDQAAFWYARADEIKAELTQ